MQKDILKAARKIITSEGAENLSIRKIAGLIEYSPATIYHYFDNKEAIIEKLLTEDYQKMLEALSSPQGSKETPGEKLRKGIYNYITLVIEMGDSYRSIMSSSSSAILAHTSVLHNGAGADRSAIAMLCNVLREFPDLAERDDTEIELAAQIIWTAVFGLTFRLIVEKVGEAQKRRLIDQSIRFILDSLKNGPSDTKSNE